MALTPKQERFVAEYLIDLNATQAAIRAGYSADTAKQQGSRLLTNADVAAAVAARQVKVGNKLEITAERVADELSRIAFMQCPEDEAALLSVKRAALVDLGKHLGMFVDRVKVEHTPLDDFDAATLEAIGRGAAARFAEADPSGGAPAGPPPAGKIPAVH
jgi:hypothetical protein